MIKDILVQALNSGNLFKKLLLNMNPDFFFRGEEKEGEE